MADSKKSFSDYEALFDSREKALIEQQRNVTSFVIQTNHGAKEIRIFLEKVCTAETEINDNLEELLKLKNRYEDFKTEGIALCQRARDLKQYTRDMKSDLLADLARHQPSILQNAGFLAAVIVGAVAAVKNGLADHSISPNQAAELGGVLGLLVIFRKKIKNGYTAASKTVCSAPKQIKAGFRSASKAVCEAPQQIWDSNSFIYVRGMLKEKGRAAQQRLNMWKLRT